MYYLQSRYYNPALGRFINADMYASTGQSFAGNNMFIYCLNNPVIFIDSQGSYSEALQWWVGTAWIFCVVDAFLPIGDVIYAVGVIGLTLCCSTTLTASEITTNTQAITEATVVASGEDEGRLYTVYFLYAFGDPSKSVIYVGRVKTANFNSRMAYHRTKGRVLAGRIDGLTYDECRAIEQAGMLYHHTIGKGQPFRNQINGIGPNNGKKGIYWGSALKLVNQNRYPEFSLLPSSYLRNQAENEALNMGM